MFFFDCETHLWPAMDDISYYPPFKRYRESFIGLGRRLGMSAKRGQSKPGEKIEALADQLVASMDEAGVQIACVLPEIMTHLSYGHRVRSTNGWCAEQIAKYPDRLVGVAQVGPIVERGVENAVWELEYLVKEKNFKACKLYPPDEVPINDKRLWPFYKKVRDLGIVLLIHVGFAFVGGGRTSSALPILLEDVCEDFPEIPIVAYHLGYPYNNELNIEASKYPNLYIGTSILPGLGHNAPKLAQQLLGEAIRWAGIDKIVWGTDWSGPMVRHVNEVNFLKTIQFSEEMQKDYGYPALTEEDRAKWAGLNFARIMKMQPKK